MANQKLFPPFIETKVPAFSNSLLISFSMNPTVGMSDIIGMAVLVKTAQTGKQIGILKNYTKPTFDNALGQYTIIFSDIDSLNLMSGQYYKIQLAYIGIDDTVGYYSTAGIIKKTTSPSLTFPSLEENNLNMYEYTAKYSQQGRDVTEKLYSYCFELRDINNNLIATSGEKLHNNTDDTVPYESTDSWRLPIEPEYGYNYMLVYSITTQNGLKHSIKKMIMFEETVNIEFDIEPYCEVDYNNGSIEVYLKTKHHQDASLSGNFLLLRSAKSTNFKAWEEIYNFSWGAANIEATTPKLLFEDRTVKQGEEYLYALQTYNECGLYSNKLVASNGKVKADFEYCFLGDLEKQLRIAFNPKVSSFKTTVLESKVDTMGSKYPFIMRNGYVEYKEFPISGLISLIEDSDATFTNSLPHEFTTQLTSDNISNEREFKIEVLNWLNNGKPKMFRSPTEGNFIVRLMNISLTPNDTVGRMLHTFNCTAYEIASWDQKNLIDNNLVFSRSFKEYVNIHIGQVVLKDIEDSAKNNSLNLDYPNFGMNLARKTIYFPVSYSIKITDSLMENRFILYFSDGSSVPITISNTGTYEVQIALSPNDENGIYFKGIKLDKGFWDKTKVQYEYYDNAMPESTFTQIKKIKVVDEFKQIVGQSFDKDLINVKSYFNGLNSDAHKEIRYFHYITVKKRDLSSKDLDYRFRLNDEHYSDLTGNEDTFGYIHLDDVGTIENIHIGNGLVLDVGYRAVIKEYGIEETDANVKNAKIKFEQSRTDYLNLLNSVNYTQVQDYEINLQSQREKIDAAYDNYIGALEEALGKGA